MLADERPLAIFLMGPTASGKTALACALADRFALDLISVDSALVYRGLNIGAAKPDATTLASHADETLAPSQRPLTTPGSVVIGECR